MATKEQIEIYEKDKPMHDMWNKLTEDYTVPKRVSQLALVLKASGLDLRSQEHINLLRIKDGETGTYDILGLNKVDPLTKEGAIAFLLQLDEAIANKGILYDFTYYGKDKLVASYERRDTGYAQAFDKLEEKIPVEPQAVAEPGFFKMLTNRWFGWFKSEVDRYNNYVQERNTYEINKERIITENTRRKRIASENEELLETINITEKTRSQVAVEIKNNMTLEQKLEEALKVAKRNELTYNMVAGRNNEKVGYDENFGKILEIPLKQHPDIPVSGLALLASCSEKFNKGITDGSTQNDMRWDSTEPLTDDDKEFIKAIEAANNRSNIGGKVLESLYIGSDNIRMGNRMQAVINGRKAINEAIEAYLSGNKQLLSDLIEDCLPSLYSHVCSMSSNSKTASGKAAMEIIEAVNTMFEKDNELKEMVGYPESKFQVLKGAAKIYQFTTDHVERKLEAYRKDEGPGTEQRKDAMEKMLVDGIMTEIVVKQVYKNDGDAGDAAWVRATSKEVSKFRNKFSEENTTIQNGMMLFFKEGILKEPEIYKTFGKDGFDMEKFRASLGAQIRELPDFEELVNMEKDVLYSKDFETISKEITKKIALGEFKQKEEPQAGQDALENEAPKEGIEISVSQLG